jgi:hypothetical protein
MAIRPRLFYSALTASLLLIPVVALYSELRRLSVIDKTLWLMLLYAAFIGGGVVVLLVTATGRLAYRGETPRAGG